ncbi:hypothetical protein SNE40_008038 [Patella caerulea]|uniref:CCHC-type domain-containing protein n=1 Tax=Patella caerulea TaxID=87958 RepID=A0AAN8K0I3_PATCE
MDKNSMQTRSRARENPHSSELRDSQIWTGQRWATRITPDIHADRGDNQDIITITEDKNGGESQSTLSDKYNEKTGPGKQEIKTNDTENELQVLLQQMNAALQSMTNIKENEKQQRKHKKITSTDSDSSDDNEENNFEDVKSCTSLNRISRNKSNTKLPPFTGRETWKVWFNRFEDVTSRYGMTNEDKLDELLPKLQGTAGEFVYGQLSVERRSDYKLLCKELANRFCVIEATKTFVAKFNRRNQNYGEPPEEYAAELKRLYDKAYLRRDGVTRQEDLLRKFLDGLYDDKTRFNVEFIKEPKDIDEAVHHVVNFSETKRNPNQDRNNMRVSRINPQFSDEEETTAEEIQMISRAAPGKNKNRIIKKEMTYESDNKVSDDHKSTMKEEILKDIKEEIKKMMNKTSNNIISLPENKATDGYKREVTQPAGCFYCKDPSHFKRECPHLQRQRGYNYRYRDFSGNNTQRQNSNQVFANNKGWNLNN